MSDTKKERLEELTKETTNEVKSNAPSVSSPDLDDVSEDMVCSADFPQGCVDGK